MKGKSARYTIMKQKRKSRATPGEPQRITKAVTHIRLLEANAGKLAALNALAPVYLALCQQYVTCFCTQERPNKLRDPLFHTPLSERWHRVAIQQADGIRSAQAEEPAWRERSLSNYRHTTKSNSRTPKPIKRESSTAACNSISVRECGGSRSPTMRKCLSRHAPVRPWWVLTWG